MSNLQLALDYASQGYHIFPLTPNTKRPFKGTHGFKDATTDPETITAWWTEQPHANIAIATGHISNLLVVDHDYYKEQPDGADPLTHVQAINIFQERTGLAIPHTFMTHARGFQQWLRMPEEDIRNSSSNKLGNNIDIRGNGGYVVAPGSTVDGIEYTVVIKADLAAAPWSLINKLLSERAKSGNQVQPVIEQPSLPDNFDLTNAQTYAKKRANGILRDLQELSQTGWDGPSWGQTCWQKARDLVRLGRTEWTGIDLDKLHEAYIQVANTLRDGDDRWDRRLVGYWDNALEHVDDFEPLPASVAEAIIFGEDGTVTRVEMPRRTQDPFGLTDRMMDHFPGRLVWLVDAEKWAAFNIDTNRWDLDNGEEAGLLYRHMIENAFRYESHHYDDTVLPSPRGGNPQPSERDKFREFLNGCRTPSMRSGALSQLKSQSKGTLDDFDQELPLLGLENGVWDFDSNSFRSYEADMRITKSASFSYDPSATAPAWEKFLSEVLPDERDRHYAGKALAYSLLGNPKEKKLFICHGLTNTGKTTVIKTVQGLLGSYATKLNDRAIYEKAQGDQSWDINDAKGMRLVSVSEPTKRKRLDASTVKDFTGNGFMMSRQMYASNKQWKPIGVLWLDANQLPEVSEDETEIWARIKVIYFPVQFSEDPDTPDNLRIDRTLDDRLAAEYPGIFNWLLGKLEDYRKEGLSNEPPNIQKASRKYQLDMDTASQFFIDMHEDDLLEYGDEFKTLRSDVHPEYLRWLRLQPDRAQELGKKQFNEKVVKLFGEAKKSDGVYYFYGFRFIKPTDHPTPIHQQIAGMDF